LCHLFGTSTTASSQAGYDLNVVDEESQKSGNELSILLEDGPVIVVNKPAGLMTDTPPRGGDAVVTRVKQYLSVKYEKSGNVYLGIPHRLDKPVSGAIVFSRNSKCAARLSEQCAERSIKKIYWAVLKTRPEQETGMLTDWMKKHPTEARTHAGNPDDPAAKEAKLNYEMLPGDYGGYAICQIELITGRMHQIRWQLASRGFPVVGDELYGGELLEDRAGILLHARELTFKHPIRYDEVTVTAPLPAWWPESVRVAEST
jgi:23S rRNA pseudouridine1911/1915/1917 synthase